MSSSKDIVIDTQLPVAGSSRNDVIELEERIVDIQEAPKAYEQPEETSPTRDQVTNIATIEDIPPNGGYAWVITGCVFFINIHTWGVNSSWGVLLNHYLTTNAFPGVSKFLFSLIGGLSISQALLIAPLVSLCQERFGLRPTMLFGSFVIFAALFSAGSATEIWQLIVAQGLVFGWGMGFVYLPVSVVPSGLSFFAIPASLANSYN